MRTALEIINILVVACKTKVRRKEHEEKKTNNYMEHTVWLSWVRNSVDFFFFYLALLKG